VIGPGHHDSEAGLRDGFPASRRRCGGPDPSRIPEHATDTAAVGIDAYVAGVLESAEDATIRGERARRIAADHGVWVAMASFAGSSGGGHAQAAGCSGIWSPDGVVDARAGPETGAVARATLG
jgi:predicted amidohydrolase